MEKLECLQISKFLCFKMIWSSSIKKLFREPNFVPKCGPSSKKRRYSYFWFYFIGRSWTNWSIRNRRVWRRFYEGREFYKTIGPKIFFERKKHFCARILNRSPDHPKNGVLVRMIRHAELLTKVLEEIHPFMESELSEFDIVIEVFTMTPFLYDRREFFHYFVIFSFLFYFCF